MSKETELLTAIIQAQEKLIDAQQDLIKAIKTAWIEEYV